MSYDGVFLEARLADLPPELLTHCRRTAQLCSSYAERFGYDSERALTVGLVYDVVRHWSGEALLAAAVSFGLEVDAVQRAAPVLLHGPVGAQVLRRDFGIADEELLGAVRCHTSGRAEMTLLDKILFAADKLEPEKLAQAPELHKAEELVRQDLDQAVLAILEWQIGSLLGRGKLVHLATVEARNSLLLATRIPLASRERRERV